MSPQPQFVFRRGFHYYIVLCFYLLERISQIIIYITYIPVYWRLFLYCCIGIVKTGLRLATP